jgi:hypothetical protein
MEETIGWRSLLCKYIGRVGVYMLGFRKGSQDWPYVTIKKWHGTMGVCDRVLFVTSLFCQKIFLILKDLAHASNEKFHTRSIAGKAG